MYIYIYSKQHEQVFSADSKSSKSEFHSLNWKLGKLLSNELVQGTCDKTSVIKAAIKVMIFKSILKIWQTYCH